MGAPAAVLGDRITATCATHLIPNPATGAPQPSPPLPFSAPVTTGTCATVLVGGKPAVVLGSQGMCTPAARRPAPGRPVPGPADADRCRHARFDLRAHGRHTGGEERLVVHGLRTARSDVDRHRHDRAGGWLR